MKSKYKGRDFVAMASQGKGGKWVWRVTTGPRTDKQGRRYVKARAITLVQSSHVRPSCRSMLNLPLPPEKIFFLPLPL